jgi:hypothetical protein
LKFPEEVQISPEAKDIISRLLCDVEQRLGTKGANEIKVNDPDPCGIILLKIFNHHFLIILLLFSRRILGSEMFLGKDFMKLMQPSSQK